MVVREWWKKTFSRSSPVVEKVVQRNDVFRKALVGRLSAVLSAYVESLGIVSSSGLQGKELFEKIHFKTVEGKLFSTTY